MPITAYDPSRFNCQIRTLVQPFSPPLTLPRSALCSSVHQRPQSISVPGIPSSFGYILFRSSTQRSPSGLFQNASPVSKTMALLYVSSLQPAPPTPVPVHSQNQVPAGDGRFPRQQSSLNSAPVHSSHPSSIQPKRLFLAIIHHNPIQLPSDSSAGSRTISLLQAQFIRPINL
ncbi:hypothetical protein MGYG_09139 [Nannizzia gypsea CBS 118893]|uniref:Uncharacterized protein n=1 Tax=Arthroderma gypseum (strain ATCC MYA-4604 / CBS 118893) TaxID=535722 RepID=E4V199_ARTGP|nr:hypothetical protein MGYG_09139 [Nannizzia gypsea CBS 118893]EFR03814.1 hypothetical protein MGYG_09139 [Nannizzia gypsea CBS 118893]